MARKQAVGLRTELAYDENLGKGLRRARLAAGVGFREAATLADLNITSIWRIENGKIDPTLETVAKLVALYGANLNVGPDGLMLTWMEAERADEGEVVPTTKGAGK